MNYLSRLSRSCSHRKHAGTLNTTYIYIHIPYDSTSSVIRISKCNSLSSLPSKPAPCTITAASSVNPEYHLTPDRRKFKKTKNFTTDLQAFACPGAGRGVRSQADVMIIAVNVQPQKCRSWRHFHTLVDLAYVAVREILVVWKSLF